MTTDLTAAATRAGTTAAFQDCYARFDGHHLVLGNRLLERTWRIDNGRLYGVSFRDTVGEWLARPGEVPAPQPPHAWTGGEFTVRFHTGSRGPVEAPSLSVELVVQGTAGSLACLFQAFPGVAAISTQVLTAPGPIPDWEAAIRDERLCVPDASSSGPAQDTPAVAGPTGIETEPASAPDGLPTLDLLERFDLAPSHLRLIQVELHDQTDIHNELAFEREWLVHPNEAHLALRGNLFVCEDPLTGRGLIFLKEAPLPHARPIQTPPDFRFSPAPALYYELDPTDTFGPGHRKWPLCYRVALYGHGTSPTGGLGDRWATLAYTGGRIGRTRVLHAYQRVRRTFEPSRDGQFVSNTWGDRSRDSRINTAFLSREIDAGARLGVDVTQIDDGWQHGTTSNSALAAQKGGVWEGYYAADPDFWSVNAARFPEGLEPLAAQARARGLGFGLWFSPDSSREFAHWARDVETVLSLHRRYGVNYIKIDGVKARTRLGAFRLRRFFEEVLLQSAGRVVFDLDVTAEIRPGYFGAIACGPLFVENRYTDFHRYWPHQTLRNLWKLAWYVDPARLRMEFLNSARHAALYANDPLRPDVYDPAYLFATTMAASPLGWFEVSNLSEPFARRVAELVAIWKQHRVAFFAGHITPIGQAPDGTAWTGFASVRDTDAYLLVFRERNDRPERTLDLPLRPDVRYRPRLLAGAGELTVDAAGARARLGAPQSFAFFHLARA